MALDCNEYHLLLRAVEYLESIAVNLKDIQGILEKIEAQIPADLGCE